MKVEFKTEEELRKEFEEIIELSTHRSSSDFLEYLEAQQKETIAQMKRDGFINEATNLEEEINSQHQAHQKQIARVKEEAFQKYLQSYREYKEKILALQKIADEALGEIEKQTVASVTRAMNIK